MGYDAWKRGDYELEYNDYWDSYVEEKMDDWSKQVVTALSPIVPEEHVEKFADMFALAWTYNCKSASILGNLLNLDEEHFYSRLGDKDHIDHLLSSVSEI